MGKKKGKYTNSIKKRLTCLLTSSIIFGIAVTITVVMSLYVYFFNLSRNDVVENLLDLQRKHMIPLVQNKASIIQSVMQLPVNNLNQLVQMNLDIGQGRLSQQGADVQRKWDWNFYVVNENFSGFKKYMKRKNNMRWESTQNSSWSYTTSKLKYTDLTTSEKYSLSLSSASDIVMQPIYDVNPNQFASMYTVYSEGLTYSYPYVTYQEGLEQRELNQNLLQQESNQIQDSNLEDMFDFDSIIQDTLKDVYDKHDQNKRKILPKYQRQENPQIKRSEQS